MEDTVLAKKVDEGRNAQTLREARGIPQNVVAEKLGCVQSYVAKLEAMQVLPEKYRKQLAELYKVDESLITSMQIDPDKINITIENNTFEEGSQNNTLGSGEQSNTINNHPLDEFMQACKERDVLFEELLKKEQERSDKFYKLVEALYKKIDK